MNHQHSTQQSSFLIDHLNSSAKPSIVKVEMNDDSISVDGLKVMPQLYSMREVTADTLLLNAVNEIPCLMEPFFQQTGLACLAGSSDTGKSSILRQLAISIVAGENDFLGFKLNAKHRSVIYVSTEDLERETAYLLQRQSTKYQPSDLQGLRFIFDISKLYDSLRRSLLLKPADLVIIDCFADTYSGDLKDSQRIRSYLHSFQELAQENNCLFLFLHHTAKRTENFEPSKNNLLSGQGFEAKMRLVIELRVDPINPNTRHLCIVKGNYLSASFKQESFILNFDEASFNFTSTMQRKPFAALGKNSNSQDELFKYQQAVLLRSNGLKYEEIGEAIGFASKGSVSKLLKKGSENGWSI